MGYTSGFNFDKIDVLFSGLQALLGVNKKRAVKKR